MNGKAAHQAPPQTIDTRKLKNYPGQQRFHIKGANAVLCYMGQLYDAATGVRLQHDIDWLKKNKYTVMKEMAPLILKKVESSHKTCPSCNYSRLPSNAGFCSACGHKMGQLSLVNAKDDRLVQMLKLVDPENPFSILAEIHRGENPISRSQVAAEFFTKDDIQNDIEEAGLNSLGVLAGVSGESGVPANPIFKNNPFADVNFTPR